MRDSRRLRAMIILGLGAAVGAVLTEMYVKPTLERGIKR